ncbi:hypothetical protein K488DRAFT_84238 [Vararia minispora EC-137]|uniref:Uncharacterized protein n=1 Tax=Vararia minispora EC-137 TaxID=1314806 RepID=A0ACB8QS02_9AGAM|nr:hypothetical protein K488DRAFT_84238 [Vararia minispora EC-137]
MSFPQSTLRPCPSHASTDSDLDDAIRSSASPPPSPPRAHDLDPDPLQQRALFRSLVPPILALCLFSAALLALPDPAPSPASPLGMRAPCSSPPALALFALACAAALALLRVGILLAAGAATGFRETREREAHRAVTLGHCEDRTAASGEQMLAGIFAC